MKRTFIKTSAVVIIFSTILFISCKEEKNLPPDTPFTPSGPFSGVVGTAYSFSTSAVDSDGDSIAYQFDWGDGTQSNWSNFAGSGTSVAMSKSWTQTGIYSVKVMAKDINGAISDWSKKHEVSITILGNNPPNIPYVPSGPSGGEVDTSYLFTTSTTDSDGDSVCYQFDWGDGTQSSWSGFVPSESSAAMSKSWSVNGTYSIKARAKDIHDAISNWSEPHTITITDFPCRVVDTITVGSGPVGVVVLPNGNYVYVTNGYSNNVSVIRTSDNTVVRTITVGDRPMDMAVLSNGNYIYVPNRFSYDVDVIRTSDNTVITSIPVGEWPIYCAATPNDNFVYVANWGTDNVSVIRTWDNTVVATISVNDGPGGVCVLPNGQYAYVTNMGSNNISVIKTSDNTVVSTIPTGSYPQGITVTPNGAYVYCANKFGNSVTVVRTSDNAVVATVSVSDGPARLCVLPNGNYVYVSQEYSTNVAVIRTSDNTVVATIPVGQTPAGIAPLPNGDYLYVANFDDDNVMVIGR
jgi:YVTN family beta-propeller protein